MSNEPVVPFACRIVIQADGTVVIENLGEGLEEIAKLLAGPGGESSGQPEAPPARIERAGTS